MGPWVIVKKNYKNNKKTLKTNFKISKGMEIVKNSALKGFSTEKKKCSIGIILPAYLQ